MSCVSGDMGLCTETNPCRRKREGREVERGEEGRRTMRLLSTRRRQLISDFMLFTSRYCNAVVFDLLAFSQIFARTFEQNISSVRVISRPGPASLEGEI